MANQKKVQPGSLLVLPCPPASLGKIGKEKWDSIGGEMIEMKILDRLDLHTLELLCVAHDRAAMAKESLEESGYTCVSEKGGQYTSPFFSVLCQSEKQIHSCSTQLGLNRKQRVGIIVKEDNAKPKVSSRTRKR